MSDPGLKITYSGGQFLYPPLGNFVGPSLNFDLKSVVSTIPVGLSVANIQVPTGTATFVTDQVPVNNLYGNLNVKTTTVVENYNTVIPSYINTNSNEILAANIFDRVYIAFDNTTSNDYSGMFKNMQFVTGYMAVVAGTWNITDGVPPVRPANFPTQGTNNITLPDFENLEEIYGDLFVFSRFANNIPKFPKLKKCGSITLFSTFGASPLIEMTTEHFPSLQIVQRYIFIQINTLVSINSFNSLGFVGTYHSPRSDNAGTKITDNNLVLSFPNNGVTSVLTYDNNYTGTVPNSTLYSPNYIYDAMPYKNDGIFMILNGFFGNTLTNISGFSNLLHVGGHVVLSANNFSTTNTNNYVNAFQKLLHTESILIGFINGIANNSNLHQIIAFDNLRTAGSIIITGDSFFSLFRIIGFKNVKHIFGELAIGNVFGFETKKLSVLDAFDSLLECDKITIHANKLTSILARSQLQKVTKLNSIQFITYN